MKLTSPDRAALRALVTRPPTPTDLKRSLGVETATRRWLVGAVMPLWLGAGLAGPSSLPISRHRNLARQVWPQDAATSETCLPPGASWP